MPVNQGRSAVRVLVWAVVWLGVTAPVWAQDAVKLSDAWIEGVTVTSIRAGQVHYQTAHGVGVTRSLDALQGMRLGRYPALGEAEELIERGDAAAAAELLKRVAAQAHEQWIKDYAGMLRVRCYAQADRAQDAADVYIDMVVSDADYTFIAEPPVDVVASADAAVRLRVAELAEQAMGTVEAERQTLLKDLIDAAGSPSAEMVNAAEPGGTRGGSLGLPLSSSAPPGTIANLYRNNRFDLALQTADEALSQPGKTAAELYLKGMTQLALAEQASDPAGYKSAGLSFMRVVTFFPRSAVAGPALLEAGYVHQKIGRPDLARKLYLRARPLINPEEDPAYFDRLNRLLTELDENNNE